MGPHPWNRDEIDKHTDCLPYEAKRLKARRLLLIRNPYDRVASLYNHHVRYANTKSIDQWMDTDFQTPYGGPVTELYSQYDHVIRIEHLRADLAAHGVQVNEVQRRNVSPSHVALSDALREAVRERYRNDFAAIARVESRHSNSQAKEASSQ